MVVLYLRWILTIMTIVLDHILSASVITHKARCLIEALPERHVLQGLRHLLVEHELQLNNSDPATYTSISVIGGAVDAKGLVQVQAYRSDAHAKKWKSAAYRMKLHLLEEGR
jgi:hypothetical protein